MKHRVGHLTAAAAAVAVAVSALAASTLATPAVAQSPGFSAPDGWKQVGAAPQLGFQNTANPQQVIMLVGPLPADGESLAGMLEGVLADLGASLGCEPSKADEQGPARGPLTVEAVGDEVTCIARGSLEGSGLSRVSVVRWPNNAPMNAAVSARALNWAGADPGAGAVAQSSGGQPKNPQTTGATPKPAASPGGLKALIDAVPKANRPVGARIHGSGGFIGFPAAYVYTPYPVYLFANGKATNCEGLSLTTLDFNAAKADADGDCEVWAWRAKGDEVEIRLEDGSWENLGDADGMVAFRAGERLNISFGHVGGAGFNFGTGSTNALFGETLVLDGDGRIAVSTSSSVLSSTASGAGAAAWRNGVKLTGRYLLDGNLIAIETDQGQRAVALIAGVLEKNALGHVYFGGTHFWNEDD